MHHRAFVLAQLRRPKKGRFPHFLRLIDEVNTGHLPQLFSQACHVRILCPRIPFFAHFDDHVVQDTTCNHHVLLVALVKQAGRLVYNVETREKNCEYSLNSLPHSFLLAGKQVFLDNILDYAVYKVFQF
jgi:hypothetical protein